MACHLGHLSLLKGDAVGRDVGLFTEECHPQCLPDNASAEAASGLLPGSRGESGGRRIHAFNRSFIHSDFGSAALTWLSVSP